eukprot:7381432-Prymnesium_polylepis.2
MPDRRKDNGLRRLLRLLPQRHAAALGRPGRLDELDYEAAAPYRRQEGRRAGAQARGRPGGVVAEHSCDGGGDGADQVDLHDAIAVQSDLHGAGAKIYPGERHRLLRRQLARQPAAVHHVRRAPGPDRKVRAGVRGRLRPALGHRTARPRWRVQAGVRGPGPRHGGCAAANVCIPGRRVHGRVRQHRRGLHAAAARLVALLRVAARLAGEHQPEHRTTAGASGVREIHAARRGRVICAWTRFCAAAAAGLNTVRVLCVRSLSVRAVCSGPWGRHGRTGP